MQSREDWIHSQCKEADKILAIGAADGWVWKGCNFPNLVLLDINEYPPGEFPRVVGDAHSLPFEDKSFDIACLNEILEHIHNPILALKEAARVAREKVIFTVPDEGHWTPDHKPFFTIEDRLKETGLTAEELFKEGNPDCTKVNAPQQSYHNRWYTEPLLRSHLDFLNLPYQIQTIAYDGWSWLCGTIQKDIEPELERIRAAQQAGVIFLPAYETTLDSPMPTSDFINFQAEARPRSLHIDTFPFCNAKCSFCRYHTLTRARAKMDTKLLERILDDVASWPEPIKTIVPIHYGELFLDPDWHDTLKLIETKLPRTGIVVPTNGSMLEETEIEKLAKIKTLSIVNFSVNAFFRETYQDLMGLEAENIPRIRQAIHQLKALRPLVQVWVSMVHSALYQTESEKAIFAEVWKNFAHQVNITNVAYCHDYFKPVIKPKISCRSISVDFVILSDGRVCPCCWDSDGAIIVGDVNHDKLMDIWHGEAMNNLRELHNSGRRNEVPLCSECTFS